MESGLAESLEKLRPTLRKLSELDYFAQEGEIYILRGELKNNEQSRTSDTSIYEFSFSQAWILGKMSGKGNRNPSKSLEDYNE